MQLIKIHVTNFRSVEDSEEFDAGQVVCLVGKNEAGKSALLTALAAFNPHPSTPAEFNKERDYPRRFLAYYDERHENEAIAIKTEWGLSETEISQLNELLGIGAIGTTLVLQRKYGKDIELVSPIDFDVVLLTLYQKFELSEEEIASLKNIKTAEALSTALSEIASPSPTQAKLLNHIKQNGTATEQILKYIKDHLPLFMYVSAYDRMDGTVQFEEIQQLINSNHLSSAIHRGKRLFLEFLEYAGISLDELLKQKTFETYNALLEAASNKITDQILEYWTQNPDLSVTVKVSAGMEGDPQPFNSGRIARARIYNSLHRVDTPFSERSAGFVWFFSFLVKFDQIKKGSTPVILLLDEPGLTLHGKAQADLLRFFREKLAPHHQVIYSTHSPFMVPANDLSSVRVVQDVIEMNVNRRVPKGTKVRDDVLALDADTLFPLQAALGYELTQALFVGENTLLVEGPGDILYIHALSDALRRRKRQGLDKRWIICPSGGIDKIRPFATLFYGNNLNIAVLSDQAAGDKRKIDDLRKSEILKAGQFHTIAEILGRAEADIEDIFEPALFVKILNSAYDLPPQFALTIENLDNADNTTRQIKKAEAYFKLLPDTIEMLNHFAPAEWLVRNSSILDEDTLEVQLTLERAETIFKTFNALIRT